MKFLWWRKKRDAELEQEIQSHLQIAARERTGRGESSREAEAAARRQFGNVGLVKESAREAWTWHWVAEFFQDLRYGMRMLRRNPTFAAIAILTLALGIGVTTAIFSVVNAVVLRPLPYEAADRLAMIWTDSPAENLHKIGTGYPIVEDWKKRNRSFEDLAVCSRNHPVTLTGGDEPERLDGAAVSANLFSMLGVPPVLGRYISPDDEQNERRVVVLSYRAWTQRFGSSRDILGKTLLENGAAATIVGVMPPEFQFPSKETQVWEPLSSLLNWESSKKSPYSHFWLVAGRLRPGVTFEQAQVEMSSIGREIERIYPAVDRIKNSSVSFAVNVVPLEMEVVGKDVRVAVWVLFGAVVFVLLIACTNVANILLARGASRANEFAIRRAIGGSRLRLIRQLLAECALFSLLSAVLGLFIANFLIRAIVAIAPANIPHMDQVGIDNRVLAFSLFIAALTGVIFGIAPAMKFSRTDPIHAMKTGSRSVSGGRENLSARNLLVMAEFSLAMVLLTGAGLMIRSFLHLQLVNPGFHPEQVLTMNISVPRSKSDADAISFYQQLVEKVGQIPGVRAAGFINRFAIDTNPDDIITIEGHSPVRGAQLWDDSVSAGYFQAMGTSLLQGRFFSDSDGRNMEKVAIINQTMARVFWRGENPIGQRFKFGDPQSEEPWITVVGIVEDMHRQGLDREVISQIYFPHAQSPGPGMLRDMSLSVRVSSNPLSYAREIRSSIYSIDKTVSVFGISTLDELLGKWSALRRLQTLLLGIFSGIALSLGAVGIYGLMHYAVAQRTREIGIRIAFGAQNSDVLRMVLGHGLRLAVVGVVAGLALSFALTRVLKNLLFDVGTTDPLTFAGVTVLLVATGLLAAYVPARKATRVDPMVALRYE
jgi:putative ABC transport system permease protein